MFREDFSTSSSRPFSKLQADQSDISAFAPSRCDWTEAAIKRLTELCRLPTGWDGHRGLPTDHNTATFAAQILAGMMHTSIPMPNILPLSNGGLQIEWHRNQWDVEIEITGPYKINVYTYDLTGAVETEFSLNGLNLAPLREVLMKIARQ